MQRKERFEPITKRIRKPVLYANEAQEVLKDYAPDLFPPQYQISPATPMRIVKMKDSQSFYWLHEYQGLYYAAKIGAVSEIFVAPKFRHIHYFEEIPLSTTIEVVLKDCSHQTKENTTLYVSVFYDADERKLSLQTLNLRGVDIREFPHDFWNISTVDCNGYPDTGCCGSVRYVRKSEFPEMNFGGLEIYDTIDLWTGSKTLKVFKKEDAGYSIEQMLAYWKKFWKACGC